jgi:hypothetical protein
MVRFVTEKESTHIGRCIYCDKAEGTLTEEHISPYGLNGLITLLEASCGDCATITSQIELHVLRYMWGAARTEMGYRRRHKKGANDLYPLTVIRDGVKTVREVPLTDALKVIELPIFKAPASLDGRTFQSGIECISKDQFLLNEQREDIAKRIGVDEVCPPDCDAEIFARFVAKCSYGYAIERYGVEAFETVYVRSAILGNTRDIGRWVGSPDTREFPVRKTPMSVGFKIRPDNDVLVRIKLFPRFDGAEYITVVGKMKEFHAIQYRLIKADREAPRAASL